jgi:ribulose-phosphate 3-epimerase
MKKPELVPAILVKSRIKLFRQVKIAEQKAKTIQLDIMDNKFVHHTTIQPNKLKKISNKLNIEVQLMVKYPLRYLEDLKRLNVNLIIFHLESIDHKKEILDIIREIKKHKIKVSIGLNPETPVSEVKPYLKYLDHVLIMTVHPGKQGQELLPDALKKVAKIRSWDKKIDIEVDGGVNEENILDCYRAGANKLVVGSAIFKKSSPKKAIDNLNSIINKR